MNGCNWGFRNTGQTIIGTLLCGLDGSTVILVQGLLWFVHEMSDVRSV